MAEVTATGARTKFGRTAELVRTAHVVSSQQKAVLRLVRSLAAFNGIVIGLLVTYAYFLKMPPSEGMKDRIAAARAGIDDMAGRPQPLLDEGDGLRIVLKKK